MRLVCSGVSLRGAARLLGINPKTVHLKLLRLARHSRKLHRALLARGPLDGHFQLDELETFESNRFQPLSVPVLWLERALDMYAGWLNYCRGITIRTRTSPAQALGLAQRRLSIQEWLSWRQDWHAAGRLLPSPLRTTPLQPR